MTTNEKATLWGKIVGAIIALFLAPLFLLWGWGIVAPHLNAPLFSYWEMFGIYMGLRTIGTIFKKIGG